MIYRLCKIRIRAQINSSPEQNLTKTKTNKRQKKNKHIDQHPCPGQNYNHAETIDIFRIPDI